MPSGSVSAITIRLSWPWKRHASWVCPTPSKQMRPESPRSKMMQAPAKTTTSAKMNKSLHRQVYKRSDLASQWLSSTLCLTGSSKKSWPRIASIVMRKDFFSAQMNHSRARCPYPIALEALKTFPKVPKKSQYWSRLARNLIFLWVPSKSAQRRALSKSTIWW